MKIMKFILIERWYAMSSNKESTANALYISLRRPKKVFEGGR